MKNKLLIVSAFLFGTILSFSQTYNYSISQVSVNGSTEVYEILIYADIASSSDIEVNGMQVNVSLEPGEFTNLMLLADGDVYGNFNSYSPQGIFTAAAVNGAFNPAIPSDKDIFNIIFTLDIITPPESQHQAGNFQMVRFSLDRVSGTSLPEISFTGDDSVSPALPSEQSIINLNNATGATFVNEFVVDPDGFTNPAPEIDAFDPNLVILSNNDFSIEGLTFRAHPNPTSDFIYVNNPASFEIEYSIVDLNGRIVQEEGVLAPNVETKIDVTSFNSGIYFINLNPDQNNKQSIKIIRN